MKLLLFSDVHHDLDKARALVRKAQDVDVVLAAGDFANMHRDLQETIDVLAAIETPTIVIPGNNETEDALRDACAAWDAAIVCHGTAADVAGRTFFGLGGGIPTTPWDWSFDLDEETAADALAACPDGAVLVVHSPPHGHVDSDNHFGSTSILATIERVRPPVVVCGHIHEAWGQESRVGALRVINAGPGGIVVEID